MEAADRHLFHALTYLPGSQPWRVYRQARYWIHEFNDVLYTLDLPRWTDPVPRDPDECATLIRCGVALLGALEGLERGLSPGEAHALLIEHLPFPG